KPGSGSCGKRSGRRIVAYLFVCGYAGTAVDMSAAGDQRASTRPGGRRVLWNLVVAVDIATGTRATARIQKPSLFPSRHATRWPQAVRYLLYSPSRRYNRRAAWEWRLVESKAPTKLA